MPLTVRSSQASMLISCAFVAGCGGVPLLDGCADFGLMLMRGFGAASDFMPSCEKGFAAGAGDGCGFGGGACASVGFGDELLDAGADGVADAGCELPFGFTGPPSFARRFARICERSSSATRFGGRLGSSCTFSGSMSCGGGGGGCSSAMLGSVGLDKGSGRATGVSVAQEVKEWYGRFVYYHCGIPTWSRGEVRVA